MKAHLNLRLLSFLWRGQICLLVLLFLQISVQGQSTTPGLMEAFEKDSQELLDAYIKASDINDTAASEKAAGRSIQGVVTALFQVYSSSQERLKYADPFPSGERYIAVQPEVNVCFTDKADIDSADIRHMQRRTLARVNEHTRKNIFSFFMSANYSGFNRLSDCTTYPTQVARSIGNYKLIIVDTPFVESVSGFLAENKDDLQHHTKKVRFLDKKLKLFEQGGQVRVPPTTYTFHYSLLIDRIVFDHKLETAFVQYSFKSKSSEAQFVLEKGKWILKKNTDVLEY